MVFYAYKKQACFLVLNRPYSKYMTFVNCNDTLLDDSSTSKYWKLKTHSYVKHDKLNKIPVSKAR